MTDTNMEKSVTEYVRRFGLGAVGHRAAYRDRKSFVLEMERSAVTGAYLSKPTMLNRILIRNSLILGYQAQIEP